MKDIKEQLIAQGKLSHYKYYVVKINNEYQVIKNTVLKKNNIFLDDKLETLSSDYYNSYYFPNGASVSYKVPVGYDISYKEDFFTKTQSNRFYKKYLQDRGKIKIKDLLTFVLSGLSFTNVIASTALFSLGGLDLIGNYVTEKKLDNIINSSKPYLRVTIMTLPVESGDPSTSKIFTTWSYPYAQIYNTAKNLKINKY